MANDFGQLHANKTKTTLFWANMLIVTVCAKETMPTAKKNIKKKMMKT